MVNELFVVGIGASAGGLESFMTFFSGMPVNNKMAFVLIQHLNPNRDSLTAQLLARYTSMAVCEAQDRMPVKPNHIYVLPSHYFIRIRNGILYLENMPTSQGVRKAIDIFFESLAQDKKEKSIAIVLSGNGQDGMEGCKTIRDNGGLVIAQDPDTITFKSMPQSIISSGLAHNTLPVEKMPKFIIKHVNAYLINKRGNYPRVINEDEKNNFNEILLYLKKKTDTDFTFYKKPTLIRRIYRRIEANNLKNISEYRHFLENNLSEVKNLHKDLTIKMTSFFRNPQSFEELIKNIVSNTSSNLDIPFRVWVPGCCTGEEAYSIAILLMEQPSFQNKKLQIFATDIDEEALEFARKGVYPEKIKSQISPERLKGFFDKINNKYVVKTHVRKNILFTLHNLIADVPFSKLDLISCRNLFIYLEPNVQKEIIKVLHFSLKKDGYLFLGNSETIGKSTYLFETVSKKNCLFKRLDAPLKEPVRFGTNNKLAISSSSLIESYLVPPSNNVFEQVKNHLAEEYIPAFVIISSEGEVIYFFGRLNRYLEIPEGVPNLNLLLMTRGNLSIKLRQAIKKIKNNQDDFVVSSAYIDNQEKYLVEFKVFSLKKILSQDFFVVSFNESKNLEKKDESQQGENKTKFSMKDLLEDLENRNQSLIISNEEINSINEELQAASEETETAKEEMESLNEELTVVNAQLQEKIEHQDKINDDLLNLLSSTEIATIFLDLDFCLKRFTPETLKLFNFRDSDLGRPISDITKTFIDNNFENDAKEVLVNKKNIEREIRTNTDQWYFRKVTTYKTKDKEITGLVVTFSNVTKLKNAQVLLQKSERKLQKIIEKMEFSNEELKNFAYICSHDLQEPARTISSFSKLLSKKMEDLIDTESKKYLDFICDASQRMQDMIKGALFYAQLNHKNDEVKMININQLIKKILDDLHSAINEANANITCDNFPSIVVDPLRISTVFQNLISNSLKFRNKENTHIHLGVQPHKSGYVFSVKDNGIGINMDHKGRLFQLFYRLNKKEEYPGTGIGLAICKKIINSYGGKIWLESEAGKGTTFYFTIPQKKHEEKDG